MNFDHLDDTTPVEPDDETRAAVAQRARRLRQRRAIVPGAALLVVAGAAIVAVTMLSNESNAPRRVVAGPSTTTSTTVAAQPTGAAVTRGAVTVRAQIPANAVVPGAKVPVTITTEMLLDVLLPPLHMQVCIVDPPLGKGWTGYDPGASCPVHDIALRSKQVVELVAPNEPAVYAIFLRWSPAPSGDFLPIPLRVVGNDPAESVTTRIELERTSVVAGGELHGNLVVQNNTGEPIDLKGSCTPQWTVLLAKPGEKAEGAFSLECGSAPLHLPAGTSRLPFTVRATLQACSNSDRAGETPRCLPGNVMPPLAPGDYEAQFASLEQIEGLPVPAPVPVTVTTP